VLSCSTGQRNPDSDYKTGGVTIRIVSHTLRERVEERSMAVHARSQPRQTFRASAWRHFAASLDPLSAEFCRPLRTREQKNFQSLRHDSCSKPRPCHWIDDRSIRLRRTRSPGTCMA